MLLDRLGRPVEVGDTVAFTLEGTIQIGTLLGIRGKTSPVAQIEYHGPGWQHLGSVNIKLKDHWSRRVNIQREPFQTNKLLLLDEDIRSQNGPGS